MKRMKEIKFNESNLREDEIDKKVRKVRAMVMNKNGQGLLVKYAGIYMLPGGKIDGNETELEALKREIAEESGIEIKPEEAVPFLRIDSYDKDYFDRVEQKDINRLTQTTFYEVHTDSEIDVTKKHLTESEKAKNHDIKYTNLAVMEYLVETNQSDNNKKAAFDREILTALREFSIFKQNDKEEIER